MNGAHHLKANVDRLYFKRSEGGREIISDEDCVLVESSSKLHDQFNKSTRDVSGANSCDWLVGKLS